MYSKRKTKTRRKTRYRKQRRKRQTKKNGKKRRGGGWMQGAFDAVRYTPEQRAAKEMANEIIKNSEGTPEGIMANEIITLLNKGKFDVNKEARRLSNDNHTEQQLRPMLENYLEQIGNFKRQTSIEKAIPSTINRCV